MSSTNDIIPFFMPFQMILLSEKYLLYTEKIAKIQQKIKDNSVYFILDEITDLNYRSVVNILVGALNGLSSRPMLLSTTIVGKANFKIISNEFFKSLQYFVGE